MPIVSGAVGSTIPLTKACSIQRRFSKAFGRSSSPNLTGRQQWVGNFRKPQSKLVNPLFLEISTAQSIHSGVGTMPKESRPEPTSYTEFGPNGSEVRDSKRSPVHP